MFPQTSHIMIVETEAGSGSGFENQDYEREGAGIAQTAAEVWAEADMIMKVKMALAEEFGYFREGLLLFTFAFGCSTGVDKGSSRYRCL